MPKRIEIVIASLLSVAVSITGALTFSKPATFQQPVTASGGVVATTVTASGATSLAGEVTAPYLVHVSRTAITSTATTTQVRASLRNESGAPRGLLNSYAVFDNVSSTQVATTGTVVTITLSPVHTATGTVVGTDLLYNAMPTWSAASTTVTATSTLTDSSYGQRMWYDGDYIDLRFNQVTSSGVWTGYFYAVWAERV
ncbi:MAG: hypothetical protein WC477_07280 [Patescibacteria group bacterium]